ncbi:MAG: YkgJ family cysteine cluster protein [Acidobacteriota bacterium]
MARGRQPTDWLGGADRELVRRVDTALALAEDRARGHLVCRLGCIECCIGPFEITALDAHRLRRGSRLLESVDAATASRLIARAGAQWRVLAGEFPGHTASGMLGPDEREREEFFASHSDLPCPALDPETGACVVYAYRPISCRTFGLPIHCAGELLAPCRLNFVGAAADDVPACAIDPDPGDLEGAILAQMDREGLSGDTTVAAALALTAVSARP